MSKNIGKLYIVSAVRLYKQNKTAKKSVNIVKMPRYVWFLKGSFILLVTGCFSSFQLCFGHD